MPFRVAAVTLSLLVLIANGAGAADDFAGGWGGSLNVIQGCASGVSQFTMGLNLTFTQSGNNVSGAGVATLPSLNFAQCILSPRPEPVTFQVNGTANGTAMSVPVRFDNADGTLTMTVGPTALNVALHVPSISFAASGTLLGGANTTAPAITFTARPSPINAGASATLTWTTTGATSVTIDNGVGMQPLNGSVQVSPLVTTKYTLTAVGKGGTVTAQATINVIAKGPRIVVATFPAGMLQLTGGSVATDTVVIANVGNEASTITVAANGGFSIEPVSFALLPGANQTLVITATSRPAGVYDGNVVINGQGAGNGAITVPLRLLVADAPAGIVRPQPAMARVDVAAPLGQNPAGSVPFTNTGSAAMTGIAVSDVPWIVPESGVITIPPGETRPVTFSIDRSRRPDSTLLFGGATGSLSIRFFSDAGPASRPAFAPVAMATTPPISTVTVTIVDAVKPPVTGGAPPPLAGSEVALFVASHLSLDGIFADLLLANPSPSLISGLRLFLTQSSLLATLPNLGSNVAIRMPSVSTSIFGVDTAASLMLRGNLESLTLAALRMVNLTGSEAYTTSIPVFRSDQGAGAGERIVLSGIDRPGNQQTVIVLQELSGNAGAVELQGYDATGAALGAKVPITLDPFFSTTDNALTVIDGTRSVVITNTSTGASRINAYARVRSNTTPDSWIVADPSLLPGSGTLIVPTILPATLPGQTDIYITNKSGSTINGTMEVIGTARRRAAAPQEVGVAPLNSSQAFTIRPLETQRTTIPAASGIIRLTGPAGTMSAAARVTMSRDGKSFGSALPVLPASSARSNGEVKRFSGVDDSSARTIAAHTPATFRSSLRLIEASGHSATVRVTIWYSLPLGTLVTAQAVSSKEFAIGANQTLVIRDLGRTISGPQRDTFGDIHDMQVDVEIIDGSGRVLSYVESSDNGSGDLVVRPE